MLEENKFSYRALLHGKDAEWYFARGLDDITASGSYEVRLFHDDMESLGITTADCDKEHYVVAHLFVSESAATGKQQALRVVGQTLLLTICATNAVKAFIRTCEITPKGASWGSWVDLGAASTTDIQDGSITAQKLSSDIRPNAVSPLRPLFITAGAEYNDTGVDKTKTAPWGETVTHKAGHYYLNGLGDITEEQMRMIYNAGRIVSTTPVAQYRNSSIRTNIVSALSGTEGQPLNLYYTCSGNYMEVFNNTKNTETSVVSMHATFAYSSRLKYIIPTIVVSETKTSNDVTNTFTGCKALVLCKLKRLRYSFSFKDCPLISKESVQYIIDYSASTSAITITLHPDAYARLADDADIVAALEAQPLVSLVSA